MSIIVHGLDLSRLVILLPVLLIARLYIGKRPYVYALSGMWPNGDKRPGVHHPFHQHCSCCSGRVFGHPCLRPVARHRKRLRVLVLHGRPRCACPLFKSTTCWSLLYTMPCIVSRCTAERHHCRQDGASSPVPCDSPHSAQAFLLHGEGCQEDCRTGDSTRSSTGLLNVRGGASGQTRVRLGERGEPLRRVGANRCLTSINIRSGSG